MYLLRIYFKGNKNFLTCFPNHHVLFPIRPAAICVKQWKLIALCDSLPVYFLSKKAKRPEIYFNILPVHVVTKSLPRMAPTIVLGNFPLTFFPFLSVFFLSYIYPDVDLRAILPERKILLLTG